MKTRLLLIPIVLLISTQLAYAQPIPEPTPVCKEGMILQNDICITPVGEICGEGTTYQDGICVVNSIENSTNLSSEKWDDPEFTGEQISNDSCPVHYFLNYAWEDCGSILTWSILGIPLLVIITTPFGIIFAIIIWRIRK